MTGFRRDSENVKVTALCFTRATSQSPCLHGTLTTAAIASKIREAYFISFTRATSHMEKKMESIRLNKYLSDAGVCSRREADRWIEQGYVTVNGEAASMGIKIAPDSEVRVHGKPVKLSLIHI